MRICDCNAASLLRSRLKSTSRRRAARDGEDFSIPKDKKKARSTELQVKLVCASLLRSILKFLIQQSHKGPTSIHLHPICTQGACQILVIYVTDTMPPLMHMATFPTAYHVYGCHRVSDDALCSCARGACLAPPNAWSYLLRNPPCNPLVARGRYQARYFRIELT
jgi:hypothetical protein